MDDIKPVVREKSVRGQEITTIAVPDIFEPLHDPVPYKSKKKSGFYYHEGYVDGKLFLVPDSTLETMKYKINFQLRPKKNSFRRLTSIEISDYDHFKKKLSPVIEKLDNIETLSEDEEDKDKQMMEGEKSPIGQPITEIPTPEKSKLRFRFLISGHFNGDQTPMYIIQEYDGPKLISGEESDFCSSKSDKDVTMFITGKFFDKNILEEFEGKPEALNTATKRILIDKNKCEIHNNNFNKVYKLNTADIYINGKFIRNELSNYVTPMLTLRVKKTPMDSNETVTQSGINLKGKEHNQGDQNDDLDSVESSTDTVLVYTPKSGSLIYKNDL